MAQNRKKNIGLGIGLFCIILMMIIAGIFIWIDRGYDMDSYVYFGLLSLIEIVLIFCICYNIYKMYKENISYTPLTTETSSISDPYASN